MMRVRLREDLDSIGIIISNSYRIVLLSNHQSKLEWLDFLFGASERVSFGLFAQARICFVDDLSLIDNLLLSQSLYSQVRIDFHFVLSSSSKSPYANYGRLE